ncbi:MAG: DUF4445 domain-containing protein [Clostridia bacterium]|nr:DUF4445 domain-containing protein [Clostridia bacterium]
MKISVFQNGNRKEISFDGEKGDTLLELLAKNGYVLNAGCGGNGTCGKCKAEILLNGEKKTALTCKTVPADDMSVLLSEASGTGLTETDGDDFPIEKGEGYGAAVDVGTTTLAFALVDLSTGKVVGKRSMLNPQASFGADVISRIRFSSGGNLSMLKNAVLNATESVLKEFCALIKTERLEKLFVAGNTTMLNIFAGADVTGIGVAPYTAKILECVTLNNLPLSVKETVLLPSANAYVGGDALVGAVSIGIEKGNNVFVDIGTNGEIIVSNGGKYYCASTAAGPCFEGARIECGMGGTAGAIDHVFEGERLSFSTIGNTDPKGICGSGLIDAIAVMRKRGLVDETGAFDGGKYFLADGVYVTDKDVREFQLAKSAIASGIDVLMTVAGLKEEDVDNVFIAGGLGFYLNVENAVYLGLLPRGLKAKIKVVGNTALKGAQMCMLNTAYLEKSVELAKRVENVDLSTLGDFSERFMENMFFGEVDDEF